MSEFVTDSVNTTRSHGSVTFAGPKTFFAVGGAAGACASATSAPHKSAAQTNTVERIMESSLA